MAVPVQFTSLHWFRDWYVLTWEFSSIFYGIATNNDDTGLLVGSYVSNRWGRRMCVFAMSVWGICSAAIIVTAKSRDHLLAGRVLNC